LIPVLD